MQEVEKILKVKGSSNSSSGDNYSTEEQEIGTWIDGKKLYRKVISLTVENKTEQEIDISNLNIDKLLYINGTAQNQDFAYGFYYKSTADTFLCISRTTDNAPVILLQTGSTYPNVPYVANIIIEYTKQEVVATRSKKRSVKK